MRKIVYKIINKLGYRIEKKGKVKKLNEEFLLKYKTKKGGVILRSKNYIKALSDKYRDFNFSDYENGFYVSFDHFKFYIEGDEEFYILNEIFINEDYHFESTKKSIVIDIGANIGIASTYLANIGFVEKVYAFEPVWETYQQAKKNLELNNLNKKVSIENFGLGDSDKKTIFKFDPNSKGSVGISSVGSERYIDNLNAIEIEVQIKNSFNVVKKIIERHPEYQIIIKLDCEGAENEILSSLVTNNLISEVDLFMIEWHYDNYSFVLKTLLDNNFSCFTKNTRNVAGLILAFKNSSDD